MGKEKLISFLREQVFSKNISLHAPIPLSKHLMFDKGPGTKKPRKELKARDAEVEQRTLKTVIQLTEVSQLVNLSELLEHRVVE